MKSDDSEDHMKGLLSRSVPAQKEATSEGTSTAPEVQDKSTTADAGTESKEPAEPKETQETTPAPATETTPEVKTSTDSSKAKAPMLLEVTGLSSAQAFKILLDYIYVACTGVKWEYTPENSQVNKDVLRLARHFGLSQLHEHAARWLTKGLKTSNVVERLVMCEEFGLGLLREKIIERLTRQPDVMANICRCPEITNHPKILQDILVNFASNNATPTPPQKKASQDKREDEAEETAEEPEKSEAEPEKPQEKPAEEEKPKEEKPKEEKEKPSAKVEKENQKQKSNQKAKHEKPHVEKPAAKKRKAGA